jgi:cytochrome c-type biogenesis protein CcmH/NrfG
MTFQYLRPAMTAAFVLAVLSPLAARANTPEQIFVQVSPSVVVVDIFDAKSKSIGQGSGAVIGAGQVITNCHVAQKGESLKVRQLGKTFKATLQYADPDRDLCQLSVPDLQAPPVTLGTASKLKVGQRVYAIGAPKGLELTLSEGLISSLRPYEGSQYIQTSAAISPGSSGGGLFDDQGRLVGITTFQFIEGQNLNFALPVDWIGELPTRTRVQEFMAQRRAAETAKKGRLDWLNSLIALEQKEDWLELLKLSQQWVKSEPENAEAWWILGKAYFHLKQYDDAIQADRAALRIKPEDFRVWTSLGGTYYFLEQYNQAIQAYREALRIQPEYFAAWHGLGSAYQSLKQYDQAIQAYRAALRIEPENFADWYLLGSAYESLKQYDQAIQAYQEALRIQPEKAIAWTSLGRVYYSQGKRDKVREIYQTLRKLDQARAEQYFNAFILP